jgi:hypothetical protein
MVRKNLICGQVTHNPSEHIISTDASNAERYIGGRGCANPGCANWR